MTDRFKLSSALLLFTVADAHAADGAGLKLVDIFGFLVMFSAPILTISFVFVLVFVLIKFFIDLARGTNKVELKNAPVTFINRTSRRK